MNSCNLQEANHTASSFNQRNLHYVHTHTQLSSFKFILLRTVRPVWSNSLWLRYKAIRNYPNILFKVVIFARLATITPKLKQLTVRLSDTELTLHTQAISYVSYILNGEVRITVAFLNQNLVASIVTQPTGSDNELATPVPHTIISKWSQDAISQCIFGGHLHTIAEMIVPFAGFTEMCTSLKHNNKYTKAHDFNTLQH